MFNSPIYFLQYNTIQFLGHSEIILSN